MAFEDQSAYKILSDFFSNLGIQSDAELQGLIQDAMTAGYGPDQIDLIMPELEKTKAFQNRFPGYAQRIANGYNAVSLGEYLQLENQYHQILQSNGLPAGFYDDPSDFAKWIANDVSPDEVQTRVQVAVNETQKIDPTTRNLLAQFYGVGTGDLTSYFLDTKRALPVIQRQYNSAMIATAAAHAGLKVNDISRYENLYDRGVTADQASQAYGTVKSLTDTVGQTGSIYGIQYTQADAENDVFFNQNDKRRKIIAAEQATFGGRSSGATGTAQRGTSY